MTDEPEDTKAEGTAEPIGFEQRYAVFPRLRPGILETGEGSLLAQTRELVDEAHKPTVDHFDLEHAIEFAVVERSHNGALVLDPSLFDAYRSKPLYRAGTAELGSIASLIDYTNRFKGPCSVIFADDDRAKPSLTTVFDYHSAGAANEGGQAFGRHQARHNLPLSDEWQAWAALDGETITMPNFARFLEDHIVDVMAPGMIELSDSQDKFVTALGGRSRIADPAKLMELATGLRVFEDSEVSQATNLQTGEGQLTLTNRHTDGAGQNLIIPSMFVIAIPVFRHGDPYQIIVRLRYRKVQGIVFIYELWRADQVFDHAFAEAVSQATESTTLPGFLGKRGNS